MQVHSNASVLRGIRNNQIAPWLIAAVLCAMLFACARAVAAPPSVYSPDGTVTHNSLEPGGVRPSPFRHVPDEILVRFRDSSSAFSRSLSHFQIGTTVVK